MDDPISWPLIILYIVLIIFLVVLSAFFSLCETAFACMNQYRMKVRADNGNKKAQLALRFYDKFDKTLITVLIGNNIVAVLVSVISTMLFVGILNEMHVDQTISSLIATSVMTIVIYLFGDTIPKFISKAMPDKIVLFTIYPLSFFYYLFKPLSLVYEGLTSLCNKIFRMKEKPKMTEEDFSNVVESIEEEGLLEKNESDIIQASLDFVDKKVKDVLTPVERMYALNLTKLSPDKINNALLNIDYSRIPVYKGSVDNIVGILHVKTYLRAYHHNHDVKIESVLQRPFFVSTKISMDDMINGFKKSHTHIAIVKNSANKVVGMITMEDVLEELVGYIGEPNSLLKNKRVK